MFEVVIVPLAIPGLIKLVESETRVSVHAKESAALGPVPAAQVVRGRDQAEAVPLEKAGEFVLRNGLRQRAGADRREEIGDEVFAQPRSFVAEIDLVRIAQGVVGVG